MIATLELSLPHSSVVPITIERLSIDQSFLPDAEPLAIARTLQGDINAFNELVLKYERVAYSVALRILQSLNTEPLYVMSETHFVSQFSTSIDISIHTINTICVNTNH